MIKTKSVATKTDRQKDGLRILVARGRGRGLPANRYDVWMANLGPSEQLLESYLAAYQKQNPGRKLELEADKRLPLERLLGVWESLTKAGIPIKEVPARIRLKE